MGSGSCETRSTIASCGDTWATAAGSHAELWHVPRGRLTIAVSWNNDMIDREDGIFEALLSIALDSR